MREPTTAQSTVLAVVLVALALGTALAPVGAGSTGDARPSGPAEAVASTAATAPNASLVARYPADGSMVERTVVSADAVARVGEPTNDSRTGAWTVTLTLTDDGATDFTDALVETGFADHPRACPPTDGRNDDGYCLLLVVDGDAVDSFSLAPGLAQDVRSGAFADDPRLRLLAENRSEARAVWRGFLAENGTPTADGTNDGTDDGGVGAAAGGDADEDGDDSTGATPGFSATAALGAMLAATVVAARRRH
ncbi:hypothetical protein [Halorubellus litoreus]|uniref:PGF-CTERM protein n=1 Tax=Halorubellus litoreus TaxID=755308 RepID=A0ABD5VDG2_9EURY